MRSRSARRRASHTVAVAHSFVVARLVDCEAVRTWRPNRETCTAHPTARARGAIGLDHSSNRCRTPPHHRAQRRFCAILCGSCHLLPYVPLGRLDPPSLPPPFLGRPAARGLDRGRSMAEPSRVVSAGVGSTGAPARSPSPRPCPPRTTCSSAPTDPPFPPSSRSASSPSSPARALPPAGGAHDPPLRGASAG